MVHSKIGRLSQILQPFSIPGQGAPFTPCGSSSGFGGRAESLYFETLRGTSFRYFSADCCVEAFILTRKISVEIRSASSLLSLGSTQYCRPTMCNEGSGKFPGYEELMKGKKKYSHVRPS